MILTCYSDLLHACIGHSYQFFAIFGHHCQASDHGGLDDIFHLADPVNQLIYTSNVMHDQQDTARSLSGEQHVTL